MLRSIASYEFFDGNLSGGIHVSLSLLLFSSFLSIIVLQSFYVFTFNHRAERCVTLRSCNCGQLVVRLTCLKLKNSILIGRVNL